MCFGGERRLQVRLRHARGAHGKGQRKNSDEEFLECAKIEQVESKALSAGCKSICYICSLFIVKFLCDFW